MEKQVREDMPVSRIMGRGQAISAIAGILIGAAFGRVWFNILADGLPGWQSTIERAGWAIFGVFLIAGIFVSFRVFHNPPHWNGILPLPKWAIWFVLVILIEIILIVAGSNLIRIYFGHSEWIPVWTLLVVGAHFSAFGVIFRLGAFHKLAYGMCTASVISILIGSLTGIMQLWSILPGFGGAIALWGFAGWALHRMVNGRWLEIHDR